MSDAPSLTLNAATADFFTNRPEEAYTALVSEKHRKKLGQFFTPALIADFMAAWVVGNPSCQTILDPAVGLGIFFRAVLKRSGHRRYQFTGYDLDPAVLREAAALFSDAGRANIQFENKDYLFNDWDQRYDGIICNPPYFKFQDYKNRAASLRELQARLGVTLSGLTNIYAMFMLKSVNQLSSAGRAAYLVPSEFLNADYGTAIKKYLLESRALRFVILFNSHENIFNNALTTSCILLFAHDEHSQSVTFINAQSVEDLSKLSSALASYPRAKVAGKTFFSSALNPDIKWRAYYHTRSGEKFRNLVPLSTYGKIVRGIATGDNNYFTFDEKKKRTHGIADRFLLPCLTKAVQAGTSFFTQAHFDALRLKGSRVFLFNATDLTDEAVRRYLELGEKQAVNARYLTSHRNPWHVIEHRPPAPLLVTVFNRHGLRFVSNEAGVRNLTCFHSFYPRLFAPPTMELLMAYLMTDVSKAILDDDRREYGSGLNKFEPNDLNQALVLDVRGIDAQTAKTIRALYRSYRTSVLTRRPDPAALDRLNDIFSELLG